MILKTCSLAVIPALMLLASVWLAALEPPTPEQIAQYRADGTLAQRIAAARALGNHQVAPRLVERARYKLERLQKGGVVGILPDQQPKAGEGEFAPFFGKPALTMTLLGRLAARSGARVLFAWCERLPDTSPPRFALHVQAAPEAVGDADPAHAVAALNAGIEAIARRDFAQYQWTYKRYTLRPPGSGEANPYLDLYR